MKSKSHQDMYASCRILLPGMQCNTKNLIIRLATIAFVVTLACCAVVYGETDDVNEKPEFKFKWSESNTLLPGTRTTAEDAPPLKLSSSDDTDVWVEDDAGVNEIQVTLELRTASGSGGVIATDAGTFSLNPNSIAALDFSPAHIGDGTDDTRMQFKGTIFEIDAALDGLTYTPKPNYNNTPGALYLRFFVNDLGHTGDGSPQQDDESVELIVTSVNDAPVLNLAATPADVSYTENESIVSVAQNLDSVVDNVVSDVDAPGHFDEGILEIWISSNAKTQDQLMIQDSGSPGSGIELAAADEPFISTFSVSYNGVKMGAGLGNGSVTLTEDGGSVVKLSIELDDDATPAAVKALIESIGYQNVGDNPSGDTRTVSFRIGDGQGDALIPGSDFSVADTRDIQVTPINDEPVVVLPSPAMNYAEGVGPRVIDDAARVIDPDTPIIAAALWTVQITQGAQSEDVIDIIDAGTSPGPGQIGIDSDGTTVKYGSTPIGALGSAPPFTGGQALPVMFQDASLEAVQAFIRSITYENTSNDPITTTRVISIVPTDDNSGAGPIATKTVLINSNRIPPVIQLDPGETQYVENSIPVFIDASVSVSVTDSDTTDYSGGAIKAYIDDGQDLADNIYLTEEGAAPSVLSGSDVKYNGDVIGTITSSIGEQPFAISFTSNVPTSTVEALIKRIIYWNSSDTFPKGSQVFKTVNIELTEPDMLTSSFATKSLRIDGLNDSPLILNIQFPTLPPVNEGEIDPKGKSIASLLGQGIVDPDEGAVQGIAVIGNVATSGLTGQWQFRRATGSWEDLIGPSPLSHSNARMLHSSSYVRFIPDPNTTGTAYIAALAWDRTDDALDNISDGDLIDIVPRSGGTHSVASTQSNVDIVVSQINAKPVITPLSDSKAYLEKALPLSSVLENVTTLDITDNTSTTLSSARVWIDGFLPSYETLGFTNTSEIHGQWNRFTGVLELTGTTTHSNYESVLRTVTYENTSADPDATRTIYFTVNDGSVDSNAASRTVNITPNDDGPTLADLPDLALLQDQPALSAIDIHEYVTDADTELDTLVYTVTSVTSTELMVAFQLDNRHIDITPDTGKTPTADVTIEARDAANNTSTKTFTVVVHPATVYVDDDGMHNDGPVDDTIDEGLEDAIYILNEPLLATNPTVKVKVLDGLYTGPEHTDLDLGGLPIVLEGNPNNPENVVIDISEAPSPELQGRVFTLIDEPAGAVIDGFTIKGGLVTVPGVDDKGGQGGAIYVPDGAALTLQNLIITDNTALEGGGIYLAPGSSAKIIGCTIEDNTAHERGGGVFGFAKSAVQIRQSTIRDNTAADGAGMYAE